MDIKARFSCSKSCGAGGSHRESLERLFSIMGNQWGKFRRKLPKGKSPSELLESLSTARSLIRSGAWIKPGTERRSTLDSMS